MVGTPGRENVGEGHVFISGGIKQPVFTTLTFAVALVLLLSQIFNKDPVSTEKPLKQACAP